VPSGEHDAARIAQTAFVGDETQFVSELRELTNVKQPHPSPFRAKGFVSPTIPTGMIERIGDSLEALHGRASGKAANADHDEEKKARETLH
jgi:hypothetical protein